MKFFVAAVGIIDNTIPSDLFYPFGPDQGDKVVPLGYDQSATAAVYLPLAVWFESAAYTSVNVSTAVYVKSFFDLLPGLLPRSRREFCYL